jgi:glycosyltransferase involved in cell wall biosynthesis
MSKPLLIEPKGRKDFSKMPRILLATVPPHIATGYGRQGAHLVRILKELGVEVYLYPLVGIGDEHDIAGPWGTVRAAAVCDRDGDSLAALAVAKRELKCDYVLWLYDVWQIPGQLGRMCEGLIPWLPLDGLCHRWFSALINYRLQGAVRVLTMSKFAEKEMLTKCGMDTWYVPHCIDTAVYRPLESSARADLRHKWGMPQNGWIMGYVANNSGDRKQIPRAIKIFRYLRDIHGIKDAYFYIHTNPQPRPGNAFSFEALVSAYGGSQVIIPDKRYQWTDADMNEIYNCFDVYFSSSAGEGFGVPALEAQAAGVPCVLADNSAQTELTGPGIAVSCNDDYVSMAATHHLVWKIIDISAAVDALHTAYSQWRYDDAIKLAARAFATQYDLSTVKDQWSDILRRL